MNPMIGCLGVAPDKSQAITSYSSENFGGNMDCPLIVKGCRIELPVFVEGGLLFIGDLHAAQSQGEITGAGIEISGTAQFTIHIGKNKKIHWPRGENNHSIFCIGSGRPLDQAMQHATSEMVRYLGQDYGLSEENSCIVMSQAVEYMICNAVNENFTVCCYLEKSILINLIK
jgi:acetamidase/formamidase